MPLLNISTCPPTWGSGPPFPTTTNERTVLLSADKGTVLCVHLGFHLPHLQTPIMMLEEKQCYCKSTVLYCYYECLSTLASADFALKAPLESAIINQQDVNGRH